MKKIIAQMSNLTPTIKSIQDVMRQDSGVDGDGDRSRTATVWFAGAALDK